MTGRLFGVGLGPGDPELVTVKAARLISAADVIAYHCARHGRSIARGIAEPYLRDGQVEEQLVYPVTTETTDHPDGYAGAIADFYADAAARLAAHLDGGRDVVLLAEGDPLFFSSYMHMHKRLADQYETFIVPGVTSVSAASAAVGCPLVEGDETLTVLPGTLPSDVLAERLRGTEAAAIMKVSRNFAGIQDALKESGRLDDAVYVERASTAYERSAPAAEVDPDTVPYMGIVIVPGAVASSGPLVHAAGAAAAGAAAAGGEPAAPAAAFAASISASATPVPRRSRRTSIASRQSTFPCPTSMPRSNASSQPTGNSSATGTGSEWTSPTSSSPSTSTSWKSGNSS